MKTKEEIAKALDGIEYPVKIDKQIISDAAKNDLLIVYPLSDDLLEFDGIWVDEFGAWEGITVGITPMGIADDGEQCQQIQSIWCPRKDGEVYASWLVKTDIPHASFSIKKDGDLFGNGIVINVNNIV